MLINLCNLDVKYLLVPVDCMSRYLRVQPLKSKHATTTVEALKQMITIKHGCMEYGWTRAQSLKGRSMYKERHRKIQHRYQAKVRIV